MSADKITSNLKTHLQHNPSEGNVEVVIELCPVAKSESLSTLSRKEKIAIHKEKFNEEFSEVSKVISSQGGTVIESVWLNQTVKASVPATSVNKLAALKEVAAIDLPHKLASD